MSTGKHWVPLESNPEVLTEFSRTLGLDPPYGFTDVFSIDLLDMVPRPAHAILLLFPLTPALATPADAPSPSSSPESTPYFLRQTIANACGTIGLIHAFANSPVSFAAGSFARSFLESTRSLSPADRAAALETDSRVDAAHAQFASLGQTAAPDARESVDLHFVAMVHHEGRCWEMDGRREAPVEHAACTPETLLQVACDVIRKRFMARDPEELRFTILALAPVE